jgi:predicted nucleic acid-binding protein
MLDIRDLFIAAIAIKEGERLATRDKVFKKIEKLRLEIW